ncbi:MAG: hypothetical protein GEU74_02655 [Nitriliruptorales bacterium]|nr:hypothetical protein [Nitriliruptorales bacterium]
MDAARRTEVAAVGTALLQEMESIVEDSWNDMLPASRNWRPDERARAQSASRAALRALLTAFQQGDLDDQTWADLRDVVFAQGRISNEEAADLVRSVRIVGVEVLADRLSHNIGIGHEERWQLQREASAFCVTLLGDREELDPSTFDQLLTDLERSGPDLS